MLTRLTRLAWIHSIKSSPIKTNSHFSSTIIKPQIDEFSVENEPILDYLAGSKERNQLEIALKKWSSATTHVPIIIDGKEITSKHVKHQVAPFDHQKKIATFYWANSDIINDGLTKSQAKRKDWEAVPIEEKVKMILKAADLVSGKYRMDLNATTMLGQSKTVVQAEIDAACELADFFRFNAYFLKELCKYDPISPEGVKNSARFRGLEGFIAAVSPFNFTAIGGNLAAAPALMGNVVIWKPSDTAILSNYIIYKILEESGFPPGVINFIPADGPVFGDSVFTSPHFSGLNFTGSVATFQRLWQHTANNLTKYKSFPRLVGECGGKNYHFIHPSADVESVINSTIKSAFEYGGQKCSACSRLYVPRSLWTKIKEGLLEIRNKLKVASPLEYDTFFSAVIDDKAFNRISSYIKHGNSSSNCQIIGGGKYDDNKGYYIDPTIIECQDPKDRLMREEIFGPVLSVFVYEDNKVSETLNLVNDNGFALTGAIFGKDENFLSYATEFLKMSAGNFYINDKSTGSVVGQQPFGGSRLSGTNDKAGGPHYLLRWTSTQTIKESFVPQKTWRYPYMDN